MNLLWWTNLLKVKWVLVTLIVINFLGSLYGYYWYHQQLASTPVYFWPFVPDSPLSCTLFTIALCFLLMGKRHPVFTLIACLAMIKYGFWAVVINLSYWQITGTYTLVNLGLTLSHLGMFFAGAVYLVGLTINLQQIIASMLWFLVWDFMDYVIGLHPYLFAPQQLGIAMSWAIGLSIVLTGWLIVQFKRGPFYLLDL